MNCWYCLVLCTVMLAQTGSGQYPYSSSGQDNTSPPYSPAVPAPSMTTGYGCYPYQTAVTPMGSAMNGMAHVISAQGNYNLATSAAAVNLTQARRNQIQNQMIRENTYFAMKQTNQAYKRAHERPHPTAEQLARIARDGAPKPLTAKEVNPVTGKINWPSVLTQGRFAEGRAKLEALSAKKAAQGSLSFSDQMAARKTIESMFASLNEQIRELPSSDWISGHKFLRSMIYAMAHTDLQ